jgi:pyruvate kinase
MLRFELISRDVFLKCGSLTSITYAFQQSLTAILAGTFSTHKGCNIPSGNISMNVVTQKDEADLAFIATLDPEFLAASFIGMHLTLRDYARCAWLHLEIDY